MKVVALVSGGKDSCYAMMKCIQYGHEIVALANLLPADDALDELDSYMYQTVGHQIVVSYATCMGVPLFRRRIKGSTRNHDLSYSLTPGDEVEDMFILLNEVKRQVPAVTAVSSGAIASDYQRLRVESVCSRLGLVSLAYLWRQDQSLLLHEMIRSGILAIIVKVAAIGLDPSKHLGKELAYMDTHLHKLKELYGINVCGEGGEYETLTLDCPIFKNARIVLDEFQVILHSPDSIAPVGILHPLSFHLEKKMDSVSSSDSNGGTSLYLGDISTVYEVLEDHQQNCEAMKELIDITTEKYDAMKQNLKFSKSRKDDIYSISCWLQHSETSTSLQVDLEVVLMGIETQLAEHGFSWENVLYIHLYISDMNEFSTANETYVRFITQEKCRFGVPSRSTIEIPLLQVGLGRAYMEILVAQDHSKKVLHVQSISCWAPSCIGPYSQATLHNDILYMAGQLGLDPPTMLLCNGGPTAELQQALENSEAIARNFNCSISTSAILFIVYCSACIERSNRTAIENEMTRVLSEMKLGQLDTARISEVLDPIFLYVIVPDLPKRALVEVKPMLCLAEHSQAPPREIMHDPSMMQSYWAFQYEAWHDKCIQKCSIEGQVCAAILSVTEELAQNICSKSIPTANDDGDLNIIMKDDQLKRIAQFCIYRLDKILLESNLSWDDVLNFRIYFATRLKISHGTISQIFANVFSEFAQISQGVKITTEPIFNLVPVVGTGRSASFMDDIITCELISRNL